MKFVEHSPSYFFQHMLPDRIPSHVVLVPTTPPHISAVHDVSMLSNTVQAVVATEITIPVSTFVAMATFMIWLTALIVAVL